MKRAVQYLKQNMQILQNNEHGMCKSIKSVQYAELISVHQRNGLSQMWRLIVHGAG